MIVSGLSKPSNLNHNTECREGKQWLIGIIRPRTISETMLLCEVKSKVVASLGFSKRHIFSVHAVVTRQRHVHWKTSGTIICVARTFARCVTHPSRWSQPVVGRESDGEQLTVAVRPRPFQSLQLSATLIPDRRTPARRLCHHFPTFACRTEVADLGKI